jgi:hypothetical protein
VYTAQEKIHFLLVWQRVIQSQMMEFQKHSGQDGTHARSHRATYETGARTYLLGKVGDGELLRQDCADISNELREQYTLGFVAPDPSRPIFRRLRVDVPGRPELSVRVRRGVAGWNRGLSRPTPVRAGRRPRHHRARQRVLTLADLPVLRKANALRQIDLALSY